MNEKLTKLENNCERSIKVKGDFFMTFDLCQVKDNLS